jgi:hypothetical protein
MTQTSTKQQTASRLPSTRESRPALIGLAVLLIVGGALASAYLAIQSGHRAYYVKVDQEIAQGARITEDDLARVSLPEGFEEAIPSDDVDSVVGQSATTRLLPGTILMRAMVSKTAGVEDGKTRLTLPVDASPFIRGLQPGAQLALDVGSTDGESREAILAELVSVGQSEDDGGLSGSGSSTLPIVVSVDISCLSAISQGIEDKTVTPALVGSADNGSIQATCGS